MDAIATVSAAVRSAAGSLSITSDGDVLFFVGFLFLVGLGTVYDGFRKWQQYRIMQDTPRERVRSVAAGRTEVQGTARDAYGTVPVPFDTGRCLLAEYEVETYHHDDDGGNWHTVASGTLSTPFTVDDGTGTIRVEPEDHATLELDEGTEVEIEVDGGDDTPDAVATFLREHTSVDVPERTGLDGMLFDSDRRYSHATLPVGTDVYVLGGATPTDGEVAPASSDLVLRRDEGSDEFIIAAHTEAELVSDYRWRAPAEIVGGLALSSVTLFLLLAGLGV